MSSHKTVVAEFVKLIADHENVFETPVNGVGSDVSWVDRAIGGKFYCCSVESPISDG